MSSTPRLSLAHLARMRGSAVTPRYDPRELSTGIVHLGIGAFHRAHQADFTHQAPDLLEGGWGIIGVTQRSRRVVEQLRPQDYLFTLVERDPASALDNAVPRARVVASVRQALHVGDQKHSVVESLADPSTRIVSTTVTERGYSADLARCRLDRNSSAVKQDLRDARPYRTVVGQLVAGFCTRAERGHDGVTVLCCDNVVRGGELLRALCHDFLDQWTDRAADPTRAWVEARVRFPNTLVDRIVPATPEPALHQYAHALGYRDEALVAAEPYGLWVIEDDFAAGHPNWPGEHVKLVGDVGPWSDLKLRLLNGGHSLLAYLGLAHGRQTVAEATADEQLSGVLDAWLTEASTSLDVLPEGVDVRAYAADIVRRFANRGVAHGLDQIAADGSVKLPARVLPVATALVARGQSAPVSALILAAWLHRAETADAAKPLVDPAAPRLRAALGAATARPRALVERVLGPDGIVPVPPVLQGAFLDDVAHALEGRRHNRTLEEVAHDPGHR